MGKHKDKVARLKAKAKENAAIARAKQEKVRIFDGLQHLERKIFLTGLDTFMKKLELDFSNDYIDQSEKDR